MGKEFIPTEQQKKVIAHIEGHARVLAIAGSGKTTTMVYRIKNLIENHNVNPKKIRVLMFNKAASDDFIKRSKNVLKSEIPYINTFHSFAYNFIENAIKEGHLPKYNYWIREQEFEIGILIKKIIRELEKGDLIEKNKIELDEVEKSISLWKGSLISPENAGHKYNNDIVKVYKEFEKQRCEKNALTFDDFIPLTVSLLSHNSKYKEEWTNRVKHLIVDEYQDVNLGQQKLVELLAGENTNIMVVGDDDQTIYEWRGARPEYIIGEFQTTFTSKPHSKFNLDVTFRFGPLLAQCALNSIMLNSTRQRKNVFANFVKNETDIEIEYSSKKNIYDVNDSLTQTIIKLVKGEDNVQPKKIRVIARLYSQLTGLESCFIKRGLPYKVEGSIPFYARREVTIILDYLILVENLDSEIDEKIIKSTLNIINTPNRNINKSRFELSIKKYKRRPLIDFLNYLSETGGSPEIKDIYEKLTTLLIDGNSILAEMTEKKEIKTSILVKWIYENSKLQDHYLNYFGKGEQSTNKISTTEGFISYVSEFAFAPNQLINHIKKLDSTRGKTDEEVILMSTVFKTKGLEFDYVIIPDCIEGNMPYISTNQISIFDKSKPESVPNLSDSLENERRLFYVAITRAMKKVYIGTFNRNDVNMSRFLEEIMLTDTKNVIRPMVMGDIKAVSWLAKIKIVAGRKHIIDNIKRYLNILGEDELRLKVDDISLNTTEDEFSYKRAYSNETKKDSIKKDSIWDDVEIV